MTINLDQKGLKSIADQFDLYFVDIWGVLHNGISLFEEAIEVLEQLEKVKKNYVLLTNAPRPNISVRNFLDKMGLDKNKSKKIYTSGEAALQFLNNECKDKKFFHIGPPRDFDLFNSLKKNKIKEIEKADYILCTGLFDDQDQDLNYYKKIFINEKNKIMICTNPDLVVDRGDVREYCAGSVAKVFENLGGKVEYFGKPYPNVYNLATNINTKKVLCIGDNLNTDIRGANIQNFSSLIISSGIHRDEIIDNGFENIFDKYQVKVDYIQTRLQW